MNQHTTVSRRVLVVEDEPDYAALLASVLRSGGYSVTTASNGEEALELVQKIRPDLVTLDIQMPRKTGIMFFRELKSHQQYSTVPVVVVTGLTVDDPDMKTFIHTFLDVEHLPTPDAYLEKPVERDELLRVVGDAMRAEVRPPSAGDSLSDIRYGMVRDLPGIEYEDAVKRISECLAEEGFGIITAIDVKETLKKKLDLDFQRYVILGACNPDLAHQALTHEPFIGVLLPCNVVVMERTGGGSTVVAFNPTAAFDLVENDAIQSLGEEVKAALVRVLRGMDS